MNRHHNPHWGTEERHPDAQDYILRLVADLRELRGNGITLTASPSIVSAWDAHRKDLQSCMEYDHIYASDYVAKTNLHSAHMDLIATMSQIMGVLKLRNHNYTSGIVEITDDMLNRAERLAMDLTNCRKRNVFYR